MRNTKHRAGKLMAVMGTMAGTMVMGSEAMAQSSVTLYGLLDQSVAYTTNINAAGDSMVKLPTLTGALPSRIGFRGVEDLGGGLQAIFTLEAGILMDTGIMGQGNRLFGRQASVGLKGSLGTLTLGRQVNTTGMSYAKSDTMGPNLFSLGSVDAYIPNARSDNAVGYYGNFNNIVVGATYSFGRDNSADGGPPATNCGGEVPGNSKACRQVSALLGYDNGAYGVNFAYDILYGNTGAAFGLTSSENSEKRLMLNAFVKVGQGRIGGGIMDRTTDAATGLSESDLYYLGITYPVTPALTFDTQATYRNQKSNDNDVSLLVARLTYHLSKRTAVYAALGRIKNDGVSAVPIDAAGRIGVGLSQNGVMTGIRHSF